MTDSIINFQSAFPPQDEVSWQQILAASLKNIDSSNSLLKETFEGFSLKGLYHTENTTYFSNHSGFPGAYPFLRGDKTTGNRKKSWVISQSFQTEDKNQLNKFIKEAFVYGVGNIHLDFDRTSSLSRGLKSSNDLKDIFDEVDWKGKHFSFQFYDDFLLGSTFLMDFLQRVLEQKSENFHIHNDPYYCLLLKGKLPFSMERVFSHVAEVCHTLEQTSDSLKGLMISTSLYHNSGASYSQEIAYALASLVDYLEQLKKSPLKLEKILSQIVFEFSFDANIFLNVAKIRAFRFLYHKILQTYGIEDKKQFPCYIKVVSSKRMLSLYDAWTNMMRISSASFAAALSDVDMIETFTHDSVLLENYSAKKEYDQELSYRLSRNISHILKDESYLSKVIDPTGGSYFIEELTHQLSEKAWQLFLQIELKGGMGKAITEGMIQSEIAKVKKLRIDKVNKRKTKITGVTQFSQRNEVLSENWEEKKRPSYHIEEKDCSSDLMKKLVQSARDYTLFQGAKGDLIHSLFDVYRDGLSFEKAAQILHSQSRPISAEKLNVFRLSQDFEKLRWEYESLERKVEVNLVIVGDYASLNARINFCRDVFEVMGLKCHEIHVSENTEQWPAEKICAQGAVLICSDSLRTENEKKLLSILTKDCVKVFTAGQPFEKQKTKPLYLGCDIYQLLEDFLHHVKEGK